MYNKVWEWKKGTRGCKEKKCDVVWEEEGWRGREEQERVWSKRARGNPKKYKGEQERKRSGPTCQKPDCPHPPAKQLDPPVVDHQESPFMEACYRGLVHFMKLADPVVPRFTEMLDEPFTGLDVDLPVKVMRIDLEGYKAERLE